MVSLLSFILGIIFGSIIGMVGIAWIIARKAVYEGEIRVNIDGTYWVFKEEE